MIASARIRRRSIQGLLISLYTPFGATGSAASDDPIGLSFGENGGLIAQFLQYLVRVLAQVSVPGGGWREGARELDRLLQHGHSLS